MHISHPPFNFTFSWRASLQLVSLLVGLAGAVILFILMWPDRLWLRMISLLLASFYVLWGGLTHSRTGTFSRRVFWEYSSIALFGVVMLWLII